MFLDPIPVKVPDPGENEDLVSVGSENKKWPDPK